MIASAPECRQYRDCSTPGKITEPASDIAAVDGNATAQPARLEPARSDLISYVIADGDLADGNPATSIFQMARWLQCVSIKFLSRSKIDCKNLNFPLASLKYDSA